MTGFSHCTGGGSASGGGGSGRGKGSGRREGRLVGGGGRGHFSPAAIYCITTWCFAQKGLRTITSGVSAGFVSRCAQKVGCYQFG